MIIRAELSHVDCSAGRQVGWSPLVAGAPE